MFKQAYLASFISKLLFGLSTKSYVILNDKYTKEMFGITVVTQCNVVDYMSVMTNLIEN